MKNYLLQLQKENNAQFQLAVGIFLLIYALLAGLFVRNVPVDGVQVYNWLFNYNLGYNHRGVMGTILQFFYPPSAENLTDYPNVILSTVPRWEYNLLALLIVMTWVLLVPRILTLSLSKEKKWFLLSVVAVLLLAPVWRTNAINIGFMDKWILLTVYLALLMIIINKPWMYLLFCASGFLIHPMMIFYSLLFMMIIIHAIYFNDRHQKKYRQWGLVIIISLLLPLVLYFLNDPQNNVNTIKQYYPETNELRRNIYNDFLYPEQNNRYISVQWSMHSRNVALGFLIFGGIPLLWIFFVALAFKKHITNFSSTLIPNSIKRKYKIFSWVDNYHLLLFLSLAAIFSLPINIFSIDWSRHLYWAWWGITIAFIYLVWNIPLSLQPQKKEKGKQNNKLLPFTCICFVLSYVYGGASLNVSHLNRPWIFTCQQFCIPLLTVNPLGQFFSNTIFYALVDQLIPIRANADNIRNNNSIIYETMRYKDNKLFFPENYQGTIYTQSFAIRGGRSYLVTLDYETNDTPTILFSINGQQLDPIKQTNKQMQWRFSPNSLGLPQFHFYTTGGSDFSVTGFSIDSMK